MKTFIFLFILFAIHFTSYSQDTIVQTNGTILKCKIQKADSVKVFLILKNSDGNEISTVVNRRDIQTVKYHYISDPRIPLSKSYFNIGLGYGPNYGILGLKSVLGYQNCGLLIGFGSTPFRTTGYELGFQVAIKWFYVNYGIAVTGVHRYGSRSYQNNETDYLTIGCMLNLGQSKRVFIDLGIGFNISDYVYNNYYGTIEEHNYGGAIGVGYRFGKKSK